MQFPAPLIPATLVRRYKRFLADVVLPDGETVTVHVANPGAMTRAAICPARASGCRSRTIRKRKLPYSWELIEVDFGASLELVGVNTAHPNALIAEAIGRRHDRGATRLSIGAPRGEIRPPVAGRLSAGSAGATALLSGDQERAHDARSLAWPNFPTASPRVAPAISTNSPTWSRRATAPSCST